MHSVDNRYRASSPSQESPYDTRQASADEEPQGCKAGTREQILDELEEWTNQWYTFKGLLAEGNGRNWKN